MKVAVVSVFALCNQKFTDVSAVFTASVIALMTGRKHLEAPVNVYQPA
jgi:superfamily II RNA helicase